MIAAPTADSSQCLSRQCERYWHGVYATARSGGYSHEDSEDIAQEFFCWFIAKDRLAHYRGDEDEAWPFLRLLLKRFLVNRWRHARAAKRGGGVQPLRIEDAQVADMETPAKQAERKELRTAMDAARTKLRSESASESAALKIEILTDYLSDEQPAHSGAAFARQLGMNHGAFRTAASRLRRRYGQMLLAMA
jgi:DNA-directed RNA polymerase specialized sigma24 family protein